MREGPGADARPAKSKRRQLTGRCSRTNASVASLPLVPAAERQYRSQARDQMRELAFVSWFILSGCCAFLPCDPGWSYTAPSGKRAPDGWYRVSGPDGITVRSSARLFTGSLSLALEITNDADAALTILPDQVRAYDADGTPLVPDDRSKPRCDGLSTATSVSLRRGETCLIRTGWRVQPDPKKLGTIRVLHDGVRREGASVPVDVALKADL